MKVQLYGRFRLLQWCTLIVAAFLPACVPERVVWSSDGSRAVLLAPSGLFLMDPDGRVGPFLGEGVGRALWLPDGKRILVTNSITFSSWEEVSKALPERKLDPSCIDKVRKALADARGDWKAFEQLTRTLVEDDRARALLYLREQDPKLPDVAGALWPSVVDASYSVPTCYTIDLSSPAEPTPGPILFHGLQGGMMELRLSPRGDAVAITLTSHRSDAPEALAARLYVVPLDKGATPRALGLGNTYVDWSPDGTSIVYLRPVTLSLPTPAKLGALSRQPVKNQQGEFFADTQLPRCEDLQKVGFDVNTRVRAVPDGRLFFSAKGVFATDPAGLLANAPLLYSFDPAKNRDAQCLIPETSRALGGDTLQFFQPSPDGAYIALPFGDGRLSLLTLATGELRFVQDQTLPGMKNELVCAPSWRGNAELTFVRPVRNARIREIVRYTVTTGDAVSLSKDWNDNLRADWLIPTPESTQGGILP